MQLRIIATGFILYEITGSGLSLGMLGIIQLIFQLPSILYGGVLADFFKRTTIIIITQSIGTVIIFILFYLSFIDILNAWHIYVATALLSINSTIGGPARSALTANLVPKNLLINAVAANTATMQIGSVLAPILFGILTVSIGASYPLLIGSIAALISAISCLLIKNDNYIKNKNKMSPLKNIIEGFIYVKKHPILPGLYLLDIGVTVVSFYRQIMPLIADRLFKGGAAVISILTAFNSIGAIAGSFLVVFLSKVNSKGLLVLAATMIYGILLILFGLSTSLFFGALIITLLGATDAIGMTVRQAIVQLTSPDHLRGRAVSLHSVAAMTANNIISIPNSVKNKVEILASYGGSAIGNSRVKLTNIEDCIKNVGIDTLQFHGDESSDFCSIFGLPWIKTISVDKDTDIKKKIVQYKNATAY